MEFLITNLDWMPQNDFFMPPNERPHWQYAPLLLASQSPRRKDLLAQAGFQYRVAAPDVEEIYPPHLKPFEVPVFLASLKNMAAISLAKEDEIILTADSLVFQEDRILGKPQSREEAIEMLDIIQGKTHTVVTGICLSRQGTFWYNQEHTSVTIAPMSLEEITWYVDQYQPLDKAGAYGVQEWIGLCKITRLEGSYANVVGLPVHLVYQAFLDKVV